MRNLINGYFARMFDEPHSEAHVNSMHMFSTQKHSCTMNSKISVNVGSLSIEFEGTEDFIKSNLLDFVKEVTQLLSESASIENQVGGSMNTNSKSQNSNPADAKQVGNKLDMSTATIMSKINGSSAPDLTLSAAASLTYVQGQATFSRNELLAEMKTATSFYTDSMSSNFSKTLGRLVKEGKFVQKGNQNYAIHNSIGTQLQAQLLAD